MTWRTDLAEALHELCNLLQPEVARASLENRELQEPWSDWLALVKSCGEAFDDGFPDGKGRELLRMVQDANAAIRANKALDKGRIG